MLSQVEKGEAKLPPEPASRPAGPRRFAVGVIALAVVAAVVWGWTRQPPSDPKPNVFVIVLDTVRQDALGCLRPQGWPHTRPRA